jgi:hypothetical protein
VNGDYVWAFGWTQVLTLVGFVITVAIAIGGFRTFGRWKREKVEEVRMETAIAALAAAYKSKYVFQHIRSPMSYSYEWDDMPQAGETEDRRNRRGAYYAHMKRIGQNKEFFEHLWDLQPECMAIFGADTERLFMLVHQARRYVEVGCEMLSRQVIDGEFTADNRALYEQLRRDVADHGTFEPEKDRVGIMLKDFVQAMERLCRPVIDKKFKPESAPKGT